MVLTTLTSRTSFYHSEILIQSSPLLRNGLQNYGCGLGVKKTRNLDNLNWSSFIIAVNSRRQFEGQLF